MEARRKKISCTDGIVGKIGRGIEIKSCASKISQGCGVYFVAIVDVLFSPGLDWCYLGFAGFDKKRRRSFRDINREQEDVEEADKLL